MRISAGPCKTVINAHESTDALPALRHGLTQRLGVFVFTDIVGSTDLWLKLGQLFLETKSAHDRLLLRLCSEFGGEAIAPTGDGFFFFFNAPGPATHFAIAVQREILGVLTDSRPLSVRIGMHMGEAFATPTPERSNYEGINVNIAARAMNAAVGGQVLVTRMVADGVERGSDFELESVGHVPLKGVGVRELFQVVHPALRYTQNPPVGADRVPEPFGPMIGREGEYRSVIGAFRGGARLVTITGFGGMGKSRLAIEVARNVDTEEHFRTYAYTDVIWISGSDTRDQSDVLDALARALELPLDLPHGSGGPETLRLLGRWSESRRPLIALDCLEVNPERTALCVALLGSMKSAALLVTSRIRLSIRSEHVVTLGPLDPSAARDLLKERCEAAGFVAGKHAETELDQLCQDTEGLPLSIVLAAAMTPDRSIRDIREGLTKLQGMHSVLADLPARHESLDRLSEWSVRGLNGAARRSLARLSLFMGRFRREDAEAVLASKDVQSSLADLRNHNLLLIEADSRGGGTVFRLLRPVRTYSRNVLTRKFRVGFVEKAAYVDRVRQAHEDNFRLIRTFDGPFAAERMAEGLGDLSNALDLSLESGWTVAALRLTVLFAETLYRMGKVRRALDVLETTLKATAESSSEHVVEAAWARYSRASIWYDLEELNLCAQELRSLLEIPEGVLDDSLRARCLNLAGCVAVDEGRHLEGRGLFTACLSLCLPQDHTLIAIAQHNLGRALAREGATEDATAAYRQAIIHWDAVGDAKGKSETLCNLGVMAFNSHQFARARDYYSESIRFHPDPETSVGAAISKFNLGEVEERLGNREKALQLMRESHAILELLEAGPRETVEESLRRLEAG